MAVVLLWMTGQQPPEENHQKEDERPESTIQLKELHKNVHIKSKFIK